MRLGVSKQVRHCSGGETSRAPLRWKPAICQLANVLLLDCSHGSSLGDLLVNQPLCFADERFRHLTSFTLRQGLPLRPIELRHATRRHCG